MTNVCKLWLNFLFWSFPLAFSALTDHEIDIWQDNCSICSGIHRGRGKRKGHENIWNPGQKWRWKFGWGWIHKGWLIYSLWVHSVLPQAFKTRNLFLPTRKFWTILLTLNFYLLLKLQSTMLNSKSSGQNLNRWV